MRSPKRKSWRADIFLWIIQYGNNLMGKERSPCSQLGSSWSPIPASSCLAHKPEPQEVTSRKNSKSQPCPIFTAPRGSLRLTELSKDGSTWPSMSDSNILSLTPHHEPPPSSYPENSAIPRMHQDIQDWPFAHASSYLESLPWALIHLKHWPSVTQL